VRGTSSANACLCIGLLGLTRSAIFEAPGRSSRRICISFPIHSPGTKVAKPVTFPPGRERLCTRPIPTGSATATNTIGMVAVADFRAEAACGPAATNTSGLRAIRSATEVASRSGGWEKRYSTVRFLPSIQPWSCSPSNNTRSLRLRARPLPSPIARKPSRRRGPCAHERLVETNSPAVVAMNSRRFIRSSSQLEDDGAYGITPRWSPHSLSKNAASQIRRMAPDGYGSSVSAEIVG